MSQQLFRLASYLRYRSKSSSKFDLHSPFIYKLYAEVLTDRSHHSGYEPVEKLRHQLLREPSYVKMCDLGARASDVAWDRKVVPMHHILHSSAVNQKHGRLLYRLVRYFHPATMLELGTSVGIGSAYMAFGNPEGKMITVEGCSETLGKAEQHFGRLKLSNIRTVFGGFDAMLPALLDELGTVDFVFLDGNHREEPTLHYFESLLPHLGPDSVLVFDDIHWSREMQSAWNKIRLHPSVKVTVDLFHCGLVFFREGLSKEDFIIRF